MLPHNPIVMALPVDREIVSVSAKDFVRMDLPERKVLLTPWLPEQGLAMIHAPRGVGKTFFALSCAYAVATGQGFLKFNAPSPRKVLYIDGEMPAPTMQQRIAQMINSDSKVDIPLKIITPDLQPKNERSINISDPSDQVAIASLVEESDLIIIDSISTLVRGGRENEAESWIPVQEWALNQRAEGRSVLFIHHSGKGGAQRGTSRREDVLDTVIGLRRPAEYNPEDGAVFEVHFEKSRGFIGDDAKPFEARLMLNERGHLIWTHRSLETTTYERVCRLIDEGLTQKEVAMELGINKSNVSRHAKQGRQSGDIHFG